MTIVYNIVYLITRECIDRCLIHIDSCPTNTKLITIEESVLIQWILSIDDQGLVPRAPAI